MMERLLELEKRLRDLEERITSIEKKLEKPVNIKRKESIMGHLITLKNEGFFSQPKFIGDIKKELEKRGYIYPLSSLTSPLLRAVRKKILGRVKIKGRWAYVQR